MKRIDNEQLVRIAGTASYDRGVAYAAAGRVSISNRATREVVASVQGSDRYTVRFLQDKDGWEATCDCPAAAGGAFCKHCVAVAVAEFGDGGTDEARAEGHDDAPDPVAAYLAALPRDELVDLLLDVADHDERLRRRLDMNAARAAPAGPDSAGLRREIESALRPYEFLPYRESYGYARAADEVLDELDALLAGGHGGLVRELGEQALLLIAETVKQADDSSGVIGGAAQRALEIHAEACTAAPPEGDELAHWLLAFQLSGPDWMDADVAAYADALGADGLATYRAEAHRRWEAVPRRSPSDGNAFSHERYVITQIMEQLATYDDDLDALVGVYSNDLTSAYRFVRIASALRAAQRHEEALEWALRGLDAFPGHGSDGLRDIVVAEYVRAGRLGEAVLVRHEQFDRSPGFSTYELLREVAEPAGAWAGERTWAITRLRAESTVSAPGTPPWVRGRGHSELVRVLLSEGDDDGAWQAAQHGGCTEDLWLELASRRRDPHPEDVISVYQRFVEERIARKNNADYAAAVDLVLQARDAYGRLGREREFTTYVEKLRRTHKPKRNLMAELARRGL